MQQHSNAAPAPDSLHDYRVIDLGTGHAASVAALMLAECGAEVVKVSLLDRPSRLTSVQAAIWDRSKANLALNVSSQEDRAQLDQLLERADVLIHDLTPIEATRLKLDDVALAAQYSDLVISSVTGWPAGHPKEDRPVSEVLVLGEAGLLDEQAAVGREGPLFLRFPLGGWHAAGLAVAGVVVRLLMREQGRGGGPVRTSLLQGALIPQMMHWFRTEKTGPGMGGWPKDHPATLFECADGVWIHVMGQPAHAPWMREGIAIMSAEQKAQAQRRDATVTIPFVAEWGSIEVIFKTRPSAEWLAHLWEHDIPAQAVERTGNLYADEQVQANGYVVEVDSVPWGQTLQPAVPFHIDPPPRPRETGDVPQWLPRPAPTTEARTAQQRTDAPLTGIRIVDFGNYLAGPLTATLLADLGADVIKVEMLSGDPMRPVAWAFNGCQRGKRGLALQLKDPASREIVERLVREADVVHHNLRLPVARKLGIDCETLQAINPSLIYSHVSSYGRFGPRKDWPGYDQLFQAATGWEYEGAGAGNPPTWHRFGMMDHLSAVSSLIVTLLALLQRQRTGRGQFVAASLLGSSLFTVDTAIDAHGQLLPSPKLDSRQLGLSSTERLFACADGWVAVHDNAAGAQTRLLEIVGAGVSDIKALEAEVSSLAVDEFLGRAQRAGIAAVRVGLAQQDAFFDDVDNRQSGLTATYLHPVYGRMEQPGASWDFGERVRLELNRAPPLLGQHSREILSECGFSAARIDDFIASGIVKSPPADVSGKVV